MTEDRSEKKHILIITGGMVERDFAALWIRENTPDLVIAADKGGEAALELGILPDILLGDLDSISPEAFAKLSESSGEIRTFAPEKDATDTALAIEAALEFAPERISILGATGNRADHTFTSIMGLTRAAKAGVNAAIFDSCNKIYTASGDICLRKDAQYGDFVSLAVVSDSALISMSGMKYDLEECRVPRGSSLCQSNEIEAEEAHISVRDGLVVVFESRDGEQA